MSTKIIATIIALISSFFNVNAENNELNRKNEWQIISMPFNVALLQSEVKASEFSVLPTMMTEEEYINDIPFDTFEIAFKNAASKSRTSAFTIYEEDYITDIPFDTAKVILEMASECNKAH